MSSVFVSKASILRRHLASGFCLVKVCFFVCLITFPQLTKAQSFDTKVRGSLTVNFLNSYKTTGEKWHNETGLGIFDLKVFASGESTQIKFKFDLDTYHPERPYNLVEEAVITQTLHPQVRIATGKGVVPFIRKHRGIVTNSYYDGGSLINDFFLTFSDQDRNLLTTLVLGSWAASMRHSFTVYGEDGGVMTKDSQGNPQPDIQNRQRVGLSPTSKVYDPGDQRGYSYRLDYYSDMDWDFSFSMLRYKHVLDPTTSFAFNTGGNYQKGEAEIWYEFVYGRSSSYRWSYNDRTENVAQVGWYIPLQEKLSFGMNYEFARFKYEDTYLLRNQIVDGYIYKAEMGPKYRISRRVEFVNGILYESGKVKGSYDWVNKDTSRLGEKVRREGFSLSSQLGAFF